MSDIRVRFAPSPTGELHIGGAHTALFNWLFAKNNNGSLVLRLEDTDTARSDKGFAAGILENLKWLGITWDEGPDNGGPYGPYQQSERLPVYRKHIEELLRSGRAYYCFCSAEELAAEKQAAHFNKQDYHYSRHCRNLSAGEITAFLAQGLQPVVRIKSPETGITIVSDLIRGQVKFDNSLMDDFIIAKADGWPTYNLAVVIDDHTMRISHVIRAEEHLSNTPRQIILYQALGFDLPQFAHVSMILAPDRKKLSKRHGATPIRELRERGYLPEALITYLGQLGSSGNDDLVLTTEEMIADFSLERVSRSPAVYDIDKLTWLNNRFMDLSDADRIIDMLADYSQITDWINEGGYDHLAAVVTLVKSRAKTLQDLIIISDYFFDDIEDYDTKGMAKYFTSDAAAYLHELQLLIEEIEPFAAAQLEKQIRLLADKKGIKAAHIIHPARLALTGKTASPGLFEVMELLGRYKCAQRLKKAVEFINNIDV